ncbi:MAG: DUF1501 domain-containing protein [Planctomycetota bacterium]
MLQLPRRRLNLLSGLSLLGACSSGWLPQLAASVAGTGRKPPRACILLWMSGGPSQLDTFDPKEGHKNGGPVKAIETRVPGMRIAESLPKVADISQHLAVIRSMATKEGDHSRATYNLRTGYVPAGPVQYPAMGAFLGKSLQPADSDLPAWISINPFQALNPAAWSPGFLGPSWSPLVVASDGPPPPDTNDDDADASPPGVPAPDIRFQVRNLQRPNAITSDQVQRRLELLAGFEQDFLTARPDLPGKSHVDSYARAVRMMNSSGIDAFALEQEPPAVRDAYGRTAFGQGCLLARRLVERGVPFIEVSLSSDERGGLGWDTHADNFQAVSSLCGVLDPAWAALMTDLHQRGLLESTLVVWMGEFGRTPQINENTGRDHWPASWSVVLGGAGIRGGQVYGATEADGVAIADKPLKVPALMATIIRALGLDPETTNPSNIGRPIPLADHGAEAAQELLS